jgi:hypothetical protein
MRITMPNNSSPIDTEKVKAITLAVTKTLSRTHKSSLATIAGYISVGRHFTELKEALPHGNYLTHLIENFGITKKWASRIVNIYKSEADFYAAKAH